MCFGQTICTAFTLRSTKVTEDRRPPTLRRSKPKRRLPEYTNFYEYTNLTFELRPRLACTRSEVQKHTSPMFSLRDTNMVRRLYIRRLRFDDRFWDDWFFGRLVFWTTGFLDDRYYSSKIFTTTGFFDDFFSTTVFSTTATIRRPFIRRLLLFDDQFFDDQDFSTTSFLADFLR